jgi:hypothetical protein
MAEESVRSYTEVGPYINNSITSDVTHALSPEVAGTHFGSLSNAGLTHRMSNPDNSPRSRAKLTGQQIKSLYLIKPRVFMGGE